MQMPNPRSFARRLARAAVLVAVPCASTAALAADWTQYRGVQHDGSTDEQITTNWAGGSPKELWRVPAGEGFGSFATGGDKVFFLEMRGEDDVCVAIGAADGKTLWAVPVDKTKVKSQGGPGPRTTPAVSGDKVYVFGTSFKLQCLNAADGKPVWTHDLAGEFNATNQPGAIKQWGNAISPVLVGDKVIVAGGGPGAVYLAFDKESGNLAWKTGNDKITHATPTPATIHGVEQVIFFMEQGLVSLDPKDGKELWRFPFKFSTSTASSPIVSGDVVWCSAGYGVGAGAARITKNGEAFTATKLWTDAGLPNHWTTPVAVDGFVYGIVGFKQYENAPLKCVEISTGKVKWEKPGFGSGGATILAGGKLIVQHDSGAITLVDPSPDAYKEIGKISPLTGKCWTMPVVANGKMFCRSTKEIVALDVAAK